MRIGVLAAFSEMLEHYSLTRVVLDQLHMIKRAGHHPVLLVLDNFKCNDLPPWVECRPLLPTHHKKDYKAIAELSQEHLELVPKTVIALRGAIKDLDAVLTHDIIFTGWNLVINMAVQEVAREGARPFLHWVHSVPGGQRRDFWKLPAFSKLVYPNQTDRRRCAEHFGIYESDVIVVPHALDARDFLVATPAARYVVNECKLMEADFIQTFPIPMDRAESKGLAQVIEIFGKLKKLGYSVRLVVCNSWCTNKALHDSVDNYRIMCRLAGLGDDDVAFTSRELKHLEVGVPNAVVRDLMLLSNLFICPTKSETFGFTVAEAALSGQLLVLNANLPMMQELAGAGNALYFNFGSYQQRTDYADQDKFNADVARIIANTYEGSHAMRAKTHYRKTYFSDRIWSLIENAIVAGNHGPRNS
jgi:glycosyltransferase involved in cell wall biosynthesis